MKRIHSIVLRQAEAERKKAAKQEMKKLKDVQKKLKFAQEKHDGIIEILKPLFNSCEELHQLQKPFLKDPNIP